MEAMKQWISAYIQAQKAVLDAIPPDDVAKLIEKLRDALNGGKHIFVCGNGGSASNASHFVTDLGKSASDKVGRRFRCLSLNENVSWMTAIGNDYTYDDIYVRQLENYGQAGDLLLALSVSGNSPNVAKAVFWANQHGLETIALVGGKKGVIGESARHVISIPSTHYGRVEDAQMAICHLLCYAFIEHPEWGKA